MGSFLETETYLAIYSRYQTEKEIIQSFSFPGII